MNAAKFTPGPWYWHTDHAGNVSLRTPDRGNLIVMDFTRRGMQGAQPRLAYWTGLPGGAPRERLGGITDSFSADHPDALVIAAAPDLLEQLRALRDAAMNTPALDDSAEWTLLIKRADAVLVKAEGHA